MQTIYAGKYKNTLESTNFHWVGIKMSETGEYLIDFQILHVFFIGILYLPVVLILYYQLYCITIEKEWGEKWWCNTHINWFRFQMDINLQ